MPADPWDWPSALFMEAAADANIEFHRPRWLRVLRQSLLDLTKPQMGG
jgi:hypothetical protein